MILPSGDTVAANGMLTGVSAVSMVMRCCDCKDRSSRSKTFTTGKTVVSKVMAVLVALVRVCGRYAVDRLELIKIDWDNPEPTPVETIPETEALPVSIAVTWPLKK